MLSTNNVVQQERVNRRLPTSGERSIATAARLLLSPNNRRRVYLNDDGSITDEDGTTLFAPEGSIPNHAARHAEGGQDPLTPGTIGAATSAQVAAAQTTATTALNNATTAQTTATTALNTANNAQTTAGNAQSTANAAAGDASNAIATANNAQNDALNALSVAGAAQSAADNANSNAGNAQSTADAAIISASNAQSTANDAHNNAASALTEAQNAASAASTAQGTADAAYSVATAHEARTDNPHSVTAAQVGLANVTNHAQVQRSELTALAFTMLARATAALMRGDIAAAASGDNIDITSLTGLTDLAQISALLCRGKYVLIAEHFVGGIPSSGLIGEYGWAPRNANGAPLAVNDWRYVGNEVDRPGIFRLTTDVLTDAGVILYLGGEFSYQYPVTGVGNRAGWEMNFRFRLSSVTNVEVFLGLHNDYNNIDGSAKIGVRFATNLGDTQIMAATRYMGSWTTQALAVAVASAWYDVRLRFDAAGSMRASINGGAEGAAITTNIPTDYVGLYPVIAVTARAAETKTLDTCFYGLRIPTS